MSERRSTKSKAAPAAVRGAAVSGARWIGAARAVAEGLGLVSSVLLARLIGPAEFGAAVLALFLCMLALVLREQALTAPLVQRTVVTHNHFGSAAVLSAVLGLSLGLVVLLLAPVVWKAAFGARASELAMIASAAFPIAAFGAIAQARLQRDLNFRRLAICEVAGLAAGVTLTVGLAVLGLDGEAIVIGNVAGLAVSGALAVRSVGSARPAWHTDAARELAEVGAPGALAAAAYSTYQSAGYFLVAGLFSVAQTGLYWRAYQLAVDYQGKISGIMLRVAFPVYSRMEAGDREELRARIVRLHAVLLFPLLGVLLVTSTEFVPFVYGDRWRRSGELAQILCIAGFGLVIGTGIGPLMTALGRTRALAVHTVTAVAALVVGIVVASNFGLTATAITAAVIQCATALSANYFLGSRIAGIPLRRLVRDVAAPAIAAACAIVVGGVLINVSRPDVAVAPRLLGVATIMLLFYAAVLRLVERQALRDLSKLMGSRKLPEPEDQTHAS